MINPCLFASARHVFSVLFVFFGVTLAQVYGQVTDTALVRLEVDSLIQLNRAMVGQQQFEEALQVIESAEQLAEGVFGKNHALYASCVFNHGRTYHIMGYYDDAERLYVKSKIIYEKTLGRLSVEYANSTTNLAITYKLRGFFDKAEPLYIEAKEIRAKILGRENIDYVKALNNLGSFYYDVGDYFRAERYLLEAKQIWVQSIHKTDPFYAKICHNIANLYNYQGSYFQAEQLYLEAKKIWEETLGHDQLEYVTILSNLANFYNENSNYDDALSIYIEAMDILSKSLGSEHLIHATLLINIASLYVNKGCYNEAEPLLLEAKDILLQIGYKEHPIYAHGLHNLAIVYNETGNSSNAEPLFLEAQQIWEKSLGKQSLIFSLGLENLAVFYLQNKHISDSAPLFLELNELTHRLIEKSAAYSSESQMLAYLHTFDDDLAQFQSFSQTYPNPSLTSASYNNALFYNGYLLENARRLARSVASADSLTRDTYERWQGCRRRLSKEYAKPIAERKYVAEVEAEAEGYEKTLTRNLAAFGETRKTPQWEEVRDHLHTGDAAVEFIHYRYYTPKATDSTMYAALVLLPGDTCSHLVPLCEQRSLDSLLHQKYQDKKYTRPALGASLYSLLWQPIEPLLHGVKTVYYAPSGALHSLNLDAIALKPQSDSTLIDQYKLVRLGSTRQLVAPVTASIVGNDALLFGGIRYESDSTAIQKENNRYGVAMRGSSENDLPELVDSLQAISALEPLPSTLAEVQFIRQRLQHKHFNAPLFTGFGASEEVFKHLADSISASGASARVLHLATHGYFFPDPKSEDRLGSSGLRDEPVFRISEHPFLRSGLILAGGNHAWQTGKPYKEGMEDGILTAYEISGMSLQNTELVVLSACETGLGDVTGNEGVYGLQRAFKIAGARYLIMSLWKVPDAATKDLMSAFYTHWLDEKMEIPAAFRAAQRAMKLKYGDVEMWAGFVLVE